MVAVDLPNHGSSDPARHVTTISQHAVFLGKILDHFGLTHPHAVGPDIGTPTLMRFMAASSLQQALPCAFRERDRLLVRQKEFDVKRRTHTKLAFIEDISRHLLGQLL